MAQMNINYITNPQVNGGSNINLLGSKISCNWEMFTNTQDTPSKSVTDAYNTRLGRGINTGYNNPEITINGHYYLGNNQVKQKSDEFEGDGSETEFTTTEDILEMIFVTVDDIRVAFTQDGNVITLATPPANEKVVIVRYYYVGSYEHTTGETAQIDYEFIKELGKRSDQICVLKSDMFITTDNPDGEINVMLKSVSLDNDNQNIVNYTINVTEVRSDS